MTRVYGITAVLASLLLVPAQAIAQASADEASRWELGAGIGLGANEPVQFFNGCGLSSSAGTISLRGSYSLNPWLRVGLAGSTHLEFPTEYCATPDGFRVPSTQREYPDRIRGESGYVTTEARAVVMPKGSVGSVQPFVIAGVGRIWGKDLHFPELGVGAAVPVGGLHLRFEALGRWLSVPYDVVGLGLTEDREVVELSRTSLDEERFPLLFRVGIGWRP